MINDRGNMKWTSMMLPEHLVKIREWKQEQFYDKKRDLTEWEQKRLLKERDEVGKKFSNRSK